MNCCLVAWESGSPQNFARSELSYSLFVLTLCCLDLVLDVVLVSVVSLVLLYVHRSYGMLGPGSPGRSHRLSHSSWALNHSTIHPLSSQSKREPTLVSSWVSRLFSVLRVDCTWPVGWRLFNRDSTVSKRLLALVVSTYTRRWKEMLMKTAQNT